MSNANANRRLVVIEGGTQQLARGRHFAQPKRTVNFDYIEPLHGTPVIGERFAMRGWKDGHAWDLDTSAVVDWHTGYPYAIGGIRIETRHTVYVGKCREKGV